VCPPRRSLVGGSDGAAPGVARTMTEYVRAWPIARSRPALGAPPPRACAGIAIDGPDDGWRKAVFRFEKWWSKAASRSPTIRDSYSEPNWFLCRYERDAAATSRDSQMSDGGRRVTALTTTFRFSLGPIFDPESDPTGGSAAGSSVAVTEMLGLVALTRHLHWRYTWPDPLPRQGRTM